MAANIAGRIRYRHVNIGVPKTLVRYLVNWCAEFEFKEDAGSILHDIYQTPVTPELLPLDADGKQNQHTEETIGSYELHDFFLYYTVRHPFKPGKVAFLAKLAFAGKYENDVILETLETFYTRFFANQFKRSAMPDGPKIGSVALSPRGDWRMPSDASARLWLEEIRKLRKQDA